jgi:hypothetical protein
MFVKSKKTKNEKKTSFFGSAYLTANSKNHARHQGDSLLILSGRDMEVPFNIIK